MQKDIKMRIMFINNEGSGFADFIDIPDELTVEQLFHRQMSSCKPEDFLIRVNRQPVTRDTKLVEGDRVSMTPTKIQGAVA